MALRPTDFKSVASTRSATGASSCSVEARVGIQVTWKWLVLHHFAQPFFRLPHPVPLPIWGRKSTSKCNPTIPEDRPEFPLPSFVNMG